MKTLYINTKGIKNISEKVDLMILEHQKSYDNQRKSFDHHRVLVSSLNRQLKHIETALFNGDNVDPSGERQGDIRLASINPEATQGSIEQRFSKSVEHAETVRLQAGNIAREKGVVLLKSLFEEKKIRSSVALGNQQKAAELGAIFAKQATARNPEMTENTRSVSNG
ncbi:MAG: hypothetical protein GY742_16600 [Hyphomicrobiales bacterium]|nr:hypothetical protein [Hyphomicrobiales bacterium]